MKKTTLLLLITAIITSSSLFGQDTISKEDIEKNYSAKMGNLRFQRNYVQFANIKNDEIQTETLKVYNQWRKPIDFHFKNNPDYIICKAIPASLESGKEGIILVSFDAKKKNDFGYVFYRLGIQTTDSLEPMKLFNVSANITEDFSKLTPEQLENAPVIKFKNEKYNFGEVTSGTKVKYNFEFTNEGKSDLIIRKTKASCGCTASNPEKTILKPGESSYIAINFNTAGRKGSQNKTITVICNDPKNFQKILFVAGKVIDKPKYQPEIFPIAMGNLSFKTNHLAFQVITNKEILTDSIAIFNNAKTPMNLGLSNLPEWLNVKTNPTILPPNEKGYITISYDGSKRNDFGLIFDSIVLVTNDYKEPEKTVTISAKVLPDFSQLTKEELMNAPKIVFNTDNYNFGKLTKDSKIKHKFEFTNNGKSNLIILKTISSCDCLEIKSNKTKIKKGKSAKLSIVFNTEGRTKDQQHIITIITNDPTNPEIDLNIGGEIEFE